MESPIIMRVLASSVSLASQAGSIIRKVLASKELGIIDKGINDLQSRADRDAQRCIVNSLGHCFPGLSIVGEEGVLDSGNVSLHEELDTEVLKHDCPADLSPISLKDVVVWVDPLDGTKEFTEGLVEYVTVLIGLAVGGRPVGGVIAQPFYSSASPGTEGAEGRQYITRVVWALSGLGVFGLKPTTPSGRLPFPMDPNAKKGSVEHTAAVTRSHATTNLKDVLEVIGTTKVVKVGGCGYKALMLLEGKAHVYVFPSPGCKKWDTCAPEAILNAAGGRLTNIFGESYQYHADVEHQNRGGVLATPVADWLPHYVKCLPSSLIEQLRATC